jgi:hypothetical protein
VYENVFVVVSLTGEVTPYIAADLSAAICQHADKFGDANVAAAFIYGTEYVSVNDVKAPPAEIPANDRLTFRPVNNDGYPAGASGGNMTAAESVAYHAAADAIETMSWGTVDGFDITARAVPDNDFGADAVVGFGLDVGAAYAAGEFCYVGVIVTASRAGVALGSDSIWGSEYGTIPGVGVVNPLSDSDYMYRADLIDNAVADARMRLTEITETD